MKSANHLGHQLSETCTMDLDIRTHRAGFIGDTTEVREMFGFAQPNQIIRAVKTYCCSMHNCMTWSLYSNMANQFYNCWSTCIKLAWNVDGATKTYFVDNLLAGGLPSLRLSVLACYGKFYGSVRYSPAPEIKSLACIAAADLRSTTGSNLWNLIREFSIDPREDTSKFRQTVLDSRCCIPEADKWRIPCLVKYLEERFIKKVENQDTSEVDAVILSLVMT